MKKIFPAALITILLYGCMDNTIIRVTEQKDKEKTITYEEFNDKVSNRTATVELKNNESYKSQNISVKNDTLYFAVSSAVKDHSLTEIEAAQGFGFYFKIVLIIYRR